MILLLSTQAQRHLVCPLRHRLISLLAAPPRPRIELVYDIVYAGQKGLCLVQHPHPDVRQAQGLARRRHPTASA